MWQCHSRSISTCTAAGWRNPCFCDFRHTASEALPPNKSQSWDSLTVHSLRTCQSRDCSWLRPQSAKPPADAQCHTVSAELSLSGKKRRWVFCFLLFTVRIPPRPIVLSFTANTPGLWPQPLAQCVCVCPPGGGEGCLNNAGMGYKLLQ